MAFTVQQLKECGWVDLFEVPCNSDNIELMRGIIEKLYTEDQVKLVVPTDNVFICINDTTKGTYRCIYKRGKL